MLQERYGVKFDYDQRDGTYLVVSLDAIQTKRIVTHQLQMLLHNQIPQLLHLQVDLINDSYRLQYDLSNKKRLFQTLQTCPPTIHLFYEMAYRLVQTIADSSMYILNEEQYILHSDFIYCGRDIADLYVCYLPLPTIYMVRIEDQLRLLLLRMLASVESLSGDQGAILKLIHILQDEEYLIANLKDVLKDAWMKQAKATAAPRPIAMLTSEGNKGTHPRQRLWVRFKSLLFKQKMVKAQYIKQEQIALKSITGITEVLVNKQETTSDEIQVVISKNGTDEVIPFLEERFIIGRHQSGVHYADITEGISRVHCEFVKSNDSIEVRDLGSLNGSYLNGELLVPYKSYSYHYGDLLRIVTTEIRIISYFA